MLQFKGVLSEARFIGSGFALGSARGEFMSLGRRSASAKRGLLAGVALMVLAIATVLLPGAGASASTKRS